MSPHTAPGLSRFPFDTSVLVVIGSDRVSFPDEPFPHILAVADYDPDRTPEFVVALNTNLNLLAADLPNQRTLHALPVSEPVAVPVLRNLVLFGGVEPGQPYLLPGYAYPVAVGDIRFADECARAVSSRITSALSVTTARVFGR